MASGTVSFKPSRYDGGGMRYVRFRAWLDQINQTSGSIQTIHYEEVRRHAGTDAAARAGHDGDGAGEVEVDANRVLLAHAPASRRWAMTFSAAAFMLVASGQPT